MPQWADGDARGVQALPEPHLRLGRGRALLRARQRPRPAVVVPGELRDLRAAPGRRRMGPRLARPAAPSSRPPRPRCRSSERRDLLDQAREIVDAVAPEMLEERRRELDERGKARAPRLEVLAR